MNISFSTHAFANVILQDPRAPLPKIIYDLTGVVPVSNSLYVKYITTMQELFQKTPGVEISLSDMNPGWNQMIPKDDKGTMEKEPLVLFVTGNSSEKYLEKYPPDTDVLPYLNGRKIHSKSLSGNRPKYIATLVVKIRVAMYLLSMPDRQVTWRSEEDGGMISFGSHELVNVIRAQIGNLSRPMPTQVSVVRELWGRTQPAHVKDATATWAIAEYLSWMIRKTTTEYLRSTWDRQFGYYELELHSRPPDTVPFSIYDVGGTVIINGKSVTRTEMNKGTEAPRRRFLDALEEYVTDNIKYADISLEKLRGKRKNRRKIRPCIRRARLVSWNRIIESIQNGPAVIKIGY